MSNKKFIIIIITNILYIIAFIVTLLLYLIFNVFAIIIQIIIKKIEDFKLNYDNKYKI